MKTKITKNRIITAAVIVCVLIMTWFYGGNSADNANKPGKILSGKTNVTALMEDEVYSNSTISSENLTENEIAKSKTTIGKTTDTKASSIVTSQKTGSNQSQTDPVPSGKTLPVEPQEVTTNSEVSKHSCTISVTCKTILGHMESFNKDKLELLPPDGVIFPATEVTFYAGESVFNVLQREMKQAGIQMEFEATPLYHSNYIEGIHNIYEFDCGELSGWTYKVNGWFPNYGSSRYQIKDGDIIEWVYTCELGRGGGNNSLPKGDDE